MINKTLLKVFSVFGLAVAATGCATSTPPTHNWTAVYSERQYFSDKLSCLPDEISNRQFVASSPEFLAYRACMEERGYQLIAKR